MNCDVWFTYREAFLRRNEINYVQTVEINRHKHVLHDWKNNTCVLGY